MPVTISRTTDFLKVGRRLESFLIASFPEIVASIARDRLMAVDCPMSSQSKPETFPGG